MIQTAAWFSNTPTFTSSKNTSISINIRGIIVEKRRARALYQHLCLPSHKQKYNKLTNHLNKQKSLAYNIKYIHFQNPECSKIKNPNGSYVISVSNKTKLFKQYSSDIFQSHSDINIFLFFIKFFTWLKR